MKQRTFINKKNKKVWRHRRHTPSCKITPISIYRGKPNMLHTWKHFILISQSAFLLLSSFSPCGGLQSHPLMAVCWCTVQRTLKTSVDCPHPKCVDMWTLILRSYCQKRREQRDRNYRRRVCIYKCMERYHIGLWVIYYRRLNIRQVIKISPIYFFHEVLKLFQVTENHF